MRNTHILGRTSLETLPKIDSHRTIYEGAVLLDHPHFGFALVHRQFLEVVFGFRIRRHDNGVRGIERMSQCFIANVWVLVERV